MIKTKQDLNYYLEQDAKAFTFGTNIPKTKTPLFGHLAYKYVKLLRYTEYHHNAGHKFRYLLYKTRFYYKSYKYGNFMPLNVFGPGLFMPHPFNICITGATKIGRNCHIHQNVTIGRNYRIQGGATIGENVFIGANLCIIGPVNIANDVALGAGSVIVKDISEPGTTWAGNPAKKISEKGSEGHISQLVDK